MRMTQLKIAFFVFATTHEQSFPFSLLLWNRKPSAIQRHTDNELVIVTRRFSKISFFNRAAFTIVPDILERPVPIHVRIPVRQLSKFITQSHYIISIYQYRVVMNIDMANAIFCVILPFLVYHIKTGKRIKV